MLRIPLGIQPDSVCASEASVAVLLAVRLAVVDSAALQLRVDLGGAVVVAGHGPGADGDEALLREAAAQPFEVPVHLGRSGEEAGHEDDGRVVSTYFQSGHSISCISN